MTTTVILHTDKLPKTPAGPINGSIRYACFKDTSAKAKVSNPEIISKALLPGTNHNISDEDLEILQKSEMGKAHISQGVIEIILPPAPAEGQRLTGTSVDYPETIALRLAQMSVDLKWLKDSVAREDRVLVRDALTAQLDKHQRELEAIAKANSSV